MHRPIVLPLFAAAAVTIAGCNQAPSATAEAPAETATSAPDGSGISVGEGALRISTNPDAPSAAYVTLTGNGQAMTLTGVTSPDAERVELHESRSEAGMATMAAVSEIAVPANGAVAMRPGGLHLMLFGLNDAARTAGQVTLVLNFAGGTTVTTRATAANLAALQTPATADHGGDHKGH